jgi:Ca2+-binding RTX toxin-like protein
MRLLLGVLAVALLAPQPASAATIDFVAPGLAYSAAPGEVNVLDVRLDGTAIVFTESAAPLSTSLPFCTPRSPGVVACDPPFQLQLHVTVDLGDGNDRAVFAMPALNTINGGEGDDTLTVSNLTPDAGPLEGLGGPGNDILTAATPSSIVRGGPGEDQLTSSAATTSLFGDEGMDGLNGSAGGETLWGGADRDVILAGEGDDTVLADSQFGGDGPDTVDAGPGNDTIWGGGGNDNLLAGIGDDKVYGQDGNDRLGGEDGNDVLDGGTGDDRLHGGIGGEDTLFGGADDDRLTMGPGRDRADGGEGDDRVLGRDGVAAGLACGTGEDTAAPDARDRVHLDCETFELPVTCSRRCRATGTLMARRVVLGRGAVRMRAGRTRPLRVPLSSKGTSAVRRARSLAVQLVVDTGTRRRVTRFSLRTSL